MAYLEDAQRVRSSFVLRDVRKLEIPAVIQSFDEEEGTLSFQANGGTFEKGLKLDFLFMLEGLRIGGATQVVEVRSSTVVVEIPEDLELMERRKHSRARLNPKEGANLTALTNLFEGVGVNGALENLSEGGCRIRVEKAMNLKDQKRLPLGTSLLPRGQAFMLLKLNKVPKCPAVMELAGKVAYLDDSGGGLSIGITFEKPKADQASAIRNLVSSRSTAIPSTLPSKARRKAVVPEEPLLSSAEERAARAKPEPPLVNERPAMPGPPTVELPPPPPKASVLEEAVPEEASPEILSEAAETPRSSALLRLKKRARAVVVMASAAYGQILKDFLEEDGYGRVFLAYNRDELEAYIRQPNVGMVFIDADMALLECFEIVSQLSKEDLKMPPVIVAAEEVSRLLVIAAHRSGVAQLVVKPYLLDESFASLMEQQMGL